MSGGGRFVAFDSFDPLVPGDTNMNWDVYLLDRWSGEVERISVGSNGMGGAGLSLVTQISEDGRFVLFESKSQLHPLDGASTLDLYLRDRESQTTELITVPLGPPPHDGAVTDFASMSKDGSVIAWSAISQALLPPDANGDSPDVYVRDRRTGVTVRANVDNSGQQSDGRSYFGTVSGNGRYVAFESDSSLLKGETNPPTLDFVYVHDLLTGTTEMVSTSSTGEPSNWACGGIVSISDDGRMVAFRCGGTNLVPGQPANGYAALFVKDRWTGEVRVEPSGGPDLPVPDDVVAMRPALSPDGRYLGFGAVECTLAGDPGPCSCLTMTYYVRELASERIWRLAFRDRCPPTGLHLGNPGFPYMQWSADGNFLTFITEQRLTPASDSDVLDGFVYSFCRAADP